MPLESSDPFIFPTASFWKVIRCFNLQTFYHTVEMKAEFKKIKQWNIDMKYLDPLLRVWLRHLWPQLQPQASGCLIPQGLQTWICHSSLQMVSSSSRLDGLQWQTAILTKMFYRIQFRTLARPHKNLYWVVPKPFLRYLSCVLGRAEMWIFSLFQGHGHSRVGRHEVPLSIQLSLSPD